MTVSPRELGRLAIMQKSPLRYVERRVEHLDLPDDRHYEVMVSQQVEIPFHGDRPEEDEAAQPRTTYFPLGQFSKNRMPNLQVLAPDGSLLPLLSREERELIAASVFLNIWQRRLRPREGDLVKQIWTLVRITVSQVVSGEAQEAKEAIADLEDLITELRNSEDPELANFAEDLSQEDGLWIDLWALADSRLLIARFDATPGETYVVRIIYTERFHYKGYLKNSLWGVIRIALAWLGMISIPIARSVANLGQAASLWVIYSVPEGIEPLRCFWKREAQSSNTQAPVSVDVTRAVAAKHQDPKKETESDILLLDVQLSPSPALVATMGLSLLLLVGSVYIYRSLPELQSASAEDRSAFIALAGLFSGIPATIAGALAYRGQLFVRHASRGPRALLAGLSGIAAFFAVVVSFRDLGPLTEGVAFVLSIYSLMVFGIFGFIQLGPRWRKNELSRRRAKTLASSPARCQRKQLGAAVSFLIVWALLVLVFAQTQSAMQHQDIFTGEFPRNLWDAWSSSVGFQRER